jgi:hypothetical protein
MMSVMSNDCRVLVDFSIVSSRLVLRRFVDVKKAIEKRGSKQENLKLVGYEGKGEARIGLEVVRTLRCANSCIGLLRSQ